MKLSLVQILAAACIFANGCSSGPELDTMVHDAPRGSVFLERIPDRGIKAAHPIVIEEALVSRTLSGIMVADERTAMQKAFSKTPASVRAFSDDDVRYLAPFVTTALRQAAADQQVGFQVRSYPSDLSYSNRSGAGIGSSDPLLANSSLLETTSGHFLARDQYLYVTVTEFRKRAEKVDTINMANRRLPDPTGQADKELRFEPQEALKPDQPATSRIFGKSPEAVFAIDYKRLAQLPLVKDVQPPTASKPTPAPAGQAEVKEDDLKQIRDEMKRKDVEIETLKKEMEGIRRDMGKPPPKTP